MWRIAVPAHHQVGFCFKALRLGEAYLQAQLARLDLCRVLLSPIGTPCGIRHTTST
jgi:hypothetical protein